MCSFFFFARPTDPPSREGGRWEMKHFIGIAQSLVWLQTELDSIQSYHHCKLQFSRTEELIAKLRKKGKICSKMATKKMSKLQGQRVSYWQLGAKITKAHARTRLTTSMNVIGLFKLQLWM